MAELEEKNPRKNDPLIKFGDRGEYKQHVFQPGILIGQDKTIQADVEELQYIPYDHKHYSPFIGKCKKTLDQGMMATRILRSRGGKATAAMKKVTNVVATLNNTVQGCVLLIQVCFKRPLSAEEKLLVHVSQSYRSPLALCNLFSRIEHVCLEFCLVRYFPQSP